MKFNAQEEKKNLCFFDCPLNKGQMQQRGKGHSFNSLEVKAFCAFSGFIWKKKNKNKTEKEIKTRDEQSLFTPVSVMSSAISYLIIHIEKRWFFVLISFPPKRLRPCPKKMTRLCLWFIWKAVIGQLQTPFKIFLWYLKAHFRTKVSFNFFLRVSPVITTQWWAVYIWMSGKTLRWEPTTFLKLTFMIYFAK